jgi:hypothetical protein
MVDHDGNVWMPGANPCSYEQKERNRKKVIERKRETEGERERDSELNFRP